MVLQHFLFPTENTSDAEELYVRHTGGNDSFDTYFNILSIAKWKEYTEIKDFYLKVYADGLGIVTISDENGVLIEKEVFNADKVRIPKTNGKVVYISWNGKDGSRLVSADFCTDEAKKRDIVLAIDTCTYKREEYIKRNVDLLKKTIVENAESELFDKCYVYVIDNGRTLNEDEIESNHVGLYKNINAGGSGGYTRGLLEILNDKNDRKITNVIFMDDDVEVQPESIYRTFSLLSYLKDEYKDSVIAGAMLRNEQRYIQYECGAIRNGLTMKSCNTQLDLRVFANVLENEKPYESDYAAWWYACYSLNFVQDNNLPMPFFIKFDDAEYGIRNKSKILMLNGICICHESFEAKRNASMEYFRIRNQVITNLIGNRDVRNDVYKLCFISILSNTIRYRYDDNKIIERAIEDALKGPGFLIKTDSNDLNEQLKKLGCNMEPISGSVVIEPGEKEISRLKTMTTIYGWLLPADSSKEYCVDVYADPKDLYRRGKLKFINPKTGCGYHGRKSLIEGLKALALIIKLGTILVCKYERVSKEYRDSVQYLTGRDFWEHYLRLK